MTGSLPEEDWREMKKIFRDFAFAGMASQISLLDKSLIRGRIRDRVAGKFAITRMPSYSYQNTEIVEWKSTTRAFSGGQANQASSANQISSANRVNPVNHVQQAGMGQALKRPSLKYLLEELRKIQLIFTWKLLLRFTKNASSIVSVLLRKIVWQQPFNKGHLLGKDQKMTLLKTEVIEPE
ncbi:hypothetical protein COL940_009462 [Colletotrichum noveboracense]|nr:hypothetical protein COL940_009462 [Colletotrichum noveboracense]